MSRDDYSSLDDNDIPEVDLDSVIGDDELEIDEDILADLGDDDDDNDEDY